MENNEEFNYNLGSQNLQKAKILKSYGIDLEKALTHKYFKREGTPGNYKYYYTEADYKAGKSSSVEPKENKEEKKSGLDQLYGDIEKKGIEMANAGKGIKEIREYVESEKVEKQATEKIISSILDHKEKMNESKPKEEGLLYNHTDKELDEAINIRLKNGSSEKDPEVKQLMDEKENRGKKEDKKEDSKPKVQEGDKVKYNVTKSGGVKIPFKGEIEQLSEDGEYAHVRNSIGNLDFIPVKELNKV